MNLKTGTKLTCRETGAVFVVSGQEGGYVHYQGAKGRGECPTVEVDAHFVVDGAGVPESTSTATVPTSVLEIQEGGDHYKKLGQYQPWEVLRAWLTPEEFRGYMKGTAIAYLAREKDKGGMLDIRKGAHTLQGLIELLGEGA